MPPPGGAAVSVQRQVPISVAVTFSASAAVSYHQLSKSPRPTIPCTACSGQ